MPCLLLAHRAAAHAALPAAAAVVQRLLRLEVPSLFPQSHHHQSQHRSSSSVPEAVQRAFDGAPFAAALIPGAGRGLVAARAISQGEVVLREDPLVCVPSIENRSKVSKSVVGQVKDVKG
jgi:hypothetical protein